MPCFPVIETMAWRRWPTHRGGGREANTLMEIIKSKGPVRRQLSYGFAEEKNGTGEVIGSSTVTLARRNAFELVGLKRPVPVPAWRWKMSCWKLS